MTAPSVTKPVASAFCSPSVTLAPTGSGVLDGLRLAVKDVFDVAGYVTGPLFTDDAVTRIFEYTKGLPRRINQVCTTALMAGVIAKQSVLDESTVRKAIADLDHE